MAQEQLLRALFGNVQGQNLETVIEQLPEELRNRCREALRLKEVPFTDIIPDPFDALSMIHPSWMSEVLDYSPKALQDSMRRLFLNQKGELQKNATPLGEFVLHYMVQNWPDHTRSPVTALSDHPFFWMLALDEGAIHTVVSLLAVHEIHDFMRKIVDKKVLHNVLKILTPLQQKYLRFLLQRKSEGVPVKVSCQELIKMPVDEAKSLLSQNGYRQLSALLVGQEDLFYWHLFHRLDAAFAEDLRARIRQAHQDLSEMPVLTKRLVSVHQFLRGGKEA